MEDIVMDKSMMDVLSAAARCRPHLGIPIRSTMRHAVREAVANDFGVTWSAAGLPIFVINESGRDFVAIMTIIRDMSKSITQSQRDAFAGFGIVPPPTKAAASRLLRWIMNGGERKGERIAIIKATHAKYVGQRVHYFGRPDDTGYVLFLTWRGLDQRAALHTVEEHRYRHPLDATVRWETRATSTTSIGSLVLVD